MEAFRDKDILIVGGGDTALDWTLNLQPLARNMTLLHRRDDFRAAPDSVNKMGKLVADGRCASSSARSPALKGAAGQPRSGDRKGPEGPFDVTANALLPFFGLTMKLGPVADWGLGLGKKEYPLILEI